MEKIIQIHDITSVDLKKQIVAEVTEIVSLEIKKVLTDIQPKKPVEFINSKEVCKILGITAPTVTEWKRQGILIAYRIGNKVLFKRSEVENAPVKIDAA